jgi:citrate lyase subunit beta/citryl-CoA lyase
LTVSARSYLYVPGHRPDRFDKAMTAGADAVIFDLEDAVPVGAKDAARADVAAHVAGLAPGPVEAWVRINDGDRGLADLATLRDAGPLAGVVVPKARPDGLAALHARAPHVPLVALVESAFAVAHVHAIAAADGVRTLAMGEVDLAADLGLGDAVPDAALWALRMQVVVACAAASREAPIGPVVRDFTDLERFEAIVRQLRDAGFGAVQAIHPKQVPVVAAVFTPTAEELARMERILEGAAGAAGGVFVDEDGRMIDEAVLRTARRVLGRE